MKKTLISVLVGFAALAAYALDPVAPSFLAPNTAVYLTNNATTKYGDTNVEFVLGFNGPLEWSFNTNVINPTFVGGTVVNGVQYGGTTYYTNSQTTLPGGQIAGSAWFDVPLWPNANADSNQSPITFWYNVTASDGSPNPTNLLTFTLVRKYGTNIDNGGALANSFTLVVPVTGTTNIVGSTNLTSVFQFGATGLRLLSVKTANSTTNNYCILNNVGLSGFRP